MARPFPGQAASTSPGRLDGRWKTDGPEVIAARAGMLIGFRVLGMRFPVAPSMRFALPGGCCVVHCGLFLCGGFWR